MFAEDTSAEAAAKAHIAWTFFPTSSHSSIHGVASNDKLGVRTQKRVLACKEGERKQLTPHWYDTIGDPHLFLSSIGKGPCYCLMMWEGCREWMGPIPASPVCLKALTNRRFKEGVRIPYSNQFLPATPFSWPMKYETLPRTTHYQEHLCLWYLEELKGGCPPNSTPSFLFPPFLLILPHYYLYTLGCIAKQNSTTLLSSSQLILEPSWPELYSQVYLLPFPSSLPVLSHYKVLSSELGVVTTTIQQLSSSMCELSINIKKYQCKLHLFKSLPNQIMVMSHFF